MSANQATQRLAEVLGRIEQLPRADLEPPQFFANFLQLAAAATASAGGAVWVLQGDQPPQCYCHLELERCQIENPQQQQTIAELVLRCAREGRLQYIAAGGVVRGTAQDPNAEVVNHCAAPLFFQPLRAANQVSMVLQLIGGDQLTAGDHGQIAALSTKIAGAAETYLAHRRAVVLDDDRKALARLLQYTETVHGSLDPEKVIYQAANAGRDTIACTRTIVWIDPVVKGGLRAVSGIDKPDRRAVLLQTVEKLSRHCLRIKKPIVAARSQLVEMDEQEELTGLLKDYFNVSQLDEVFLQPMTVEDRALGVFIAEGFEARSSANLAGIVAAVAKHGAVALENALQVASMPVLRPLHKLRALRQDKQRRRRWSLVALLLLAAVVVAVLLPWTVRIDSACEMRPAVRRVIDAPLDGVEVRDVLIPAGPVSAGTVILQLDDEDLRAQLYSLEAKYEQEEIKLAQAAGQSALRKLSELELLRLANEIAFTQQQIDKCQVRAPIAGMIMTPQLELLEGMTVARGDTLLEVADLDEWELVLDVAQEEIGWVQRGLEDADGPLAVEFFLVAFPEYRMRAAIDDAGRIAQAATLDQEGNVFQVRTPVPAETLAPVRDQLRDQSIGRAKIDTVQRPLGYVLLRKVIRFFRVTFF